ncbi:LlaJI family restriction endonuclease [Exiguobacterium sp. OS-77]|uniref:LlaJI family restriction endonuclease n=1 Tax=Exiguobacterium sp. OS-77 TaxID=1241306 RepID=UPI00041FBD08|nr:LlaJI family restriction endonuclease [Exiguobacterium sp. OS-77]
MLTGPAFIKELKKYSITDLNTIFNFKNSDDRDSFFLKLQSLGIVKTSKKNSKEKNAYQLLSGSYVVPNKEDDVLYFFDYVGVIIIETRVLVIFPKYFHSESNIISNMKKILKILHKYNVESHEYYSSYSNGDQSHMSNTIGTHLFLLNDYFNYGLYNNEEIINELNGEGEINWNRTINESIAYMSGNSPYYLELYTYKTIDDETDFFRRLHACILTKCSQQLELSQIASLFDVELIHLSDEELDDFGDEEYLLNQLSSEMKMQFNTRKQILLSTMYAYIENRNVHNDESIIDLYGTNHFNLVWEKVCSTVLENKLHTRLQYLTLPVNLSSEFNSKSKLIELIDKPLWKSHPLDSSQKKYESYAKRSLTPDIVTIWNDGGEFHFLIFDAKYYDIKFEVQENKVTLAGQPGIEDITKQYLYQLAYKKFIDKHQFKKIANYFLMPSENTKITYKAIAELNILNELGLDNIQVILLPANHMFDLYLNEKKLNLETLIN